MSNLGDQNNNEQHDMYILKKTKKNILNDLLE